jgi:hypothetical protein
MIKKHWTPVRRCVAPLAMHLGYSVADGKLAMVYIAMAGLAVAT